MGRTQPEAFTVATAKALPAALTWKLRDPARPDPGRTRKATRAKGPGVASRTKQAGLGRDARARCVGAPPGRLPDPSPTSAGARGPPTPENRGPCCVRSNPFIRSTLPVPGLGESCTPAAAGEPARPSLTRETGPRTQEPRLRQRRSRRPPHTSLPTAVCAPAWRPSPSSRHFRHSNRPPMARRNRGNPPRPASSGGRRDCRAGKPAPCARARARAGPPSAR